MPRLLKPDCTPAGTPAPSLDDAAAPGAGRARPRVSLKARALRLLAQREHSRSELRRKLMPHAIAACEGDAAGEPGPCLDKLLDWLEAHRYLSAERFVESRVHARSARFGQRRIVQELAQHGLRLDADTADALQRSEFERARVVWQRRFGQPADEPGEQARQARFLAARGFSSDVIRRIVRGLAERD